MKAYESLYKLYPAEALENTFAHFYPYKANNTDKPDYDEPFKTIAKKNDGWI